MGTRLVGSAREWQPGLELDDLGAWTFRFVLVHVALAEVELAADLINERRHSFAVCG